MNTENLKQTIKNYLGWFFGGVFLLWALMVFAMDNPLAGILTMLFALSITPLRKRLFDKFNIKISPKILTIGIICLFLTSCGTTLSTDTSNSTVNEKVDVETGDLLNESEQNIDVSETNSGITDKNDNEQIEDVLNEDISDDEDIVEETLPIESETDVTLLVAENTQENIVNEIAEMQVHFIDVGQGDSTLIVCDGEAMLIDAGDDSKGTTVQNYLKKQGVSSLKYLVLTHTDADHIGGADVIVTKFDINTVFMGDFPKDNKVYSSLIKALDDKLLKWSMPGVGNVYELGSATFTIVAPNKEYSDPNNTSIGILVQNGTNRFLFTGDAEEESENDILKNGIDISCDVLHAGHHGSKTSNTKEFLNAAIPEYVVISCAEGNSYGHPSAEPLNNFRSMGIKVFRTDEQGSIIAISTGEEITWNCSPSDTWKAGESTQSSNSKQTSVNSSTKATAESTRKEEKQEPIQQQVVEPEPQVQEEIKQEEPAPTVVEPASGIMVWKSATGKKYHAINNCGNMNPNKATQITKEEAEQLGLGPCSKCF